LNAIRDYDINDYKTKSELTRTGLYTVVTAGIRSYQQIHAINASRRGLDMVVRASGQLMARQGLHEFAAGVITQICALLGLPPGGLVCVQEQGCTQSPRVIAASGAFEHAINCPLDQIENQAVIASVKDAFLQRHSCYGESCTVLYFARESGQSMAVYLEMEHLPDEIDRKLLDVFCSNISIGLDNAVLYASLHDHAYIDPLLKMPNRLSLVREIDQIIAAGDLAWAIALVDVSGFSELNDALGHRYGDDLLRGVAARLRETFVPDVIVGRISGDVFGVFGLASQVSGEVLHQLYRKPIVIGDVEHPITVTIGMARLSEIDGSGSDAIKSANIALNRAKRSQSNEACYFTRDMEFETRTRVRLLQDLHIAFDHERLFVVYQPQVALPGGRLVGAEALLRWRTDDGRYVAPDQFIPVAESSGLIISLGEWVLRTACYEQKRLENEGIASLRMAVNVSVVQFRHQRFLEMVDRALSETGINPTMLELEITESIAMLEADFMLGMLNQLKERGITVAVDDFGTGFSSLSYLERLNVDRLKVDRSFVNQMMETTSGHRIVETIVQLGHSLGLEVIAEGVETDAQAVALSKLGCHEAQGYYYGKPMTSTDFQAWLNDRKK
jgi:diguanylate cyclase (GGDEF)-like protein